MYVALFTNVRAVMQADKLLTKHGFLVVVVPVPENISSECGMCLRVDDPQQVLPVLEQNNITVTFHKIDV